MNTMPPAFLKRFHARRLVAVLWFIASLLITLLAGLYLFQGTIVSAISDIIISFGIDSLRSQFVASLILSAGTALIGAMVGRRKLAAILGAGCVFWLAYLSGFVHLEQQPTYDPGGLLEPLNNGALVQTALMMMALALLCAFVGSGVGTALAEVLLDPFLQLARFAWDSFSRSRATTESLAFSASRTAGGFQQTLTVLGRCLGIISLAALLFLASRSGNLFLFSPDVGLHSLPPLHGVKGAPAHGTVQEDYLVSRTLNGQLRPFMVYLPPSYNTPTGKNKRYPTLYLLHGSPGKDIDWMTGGKANYSADALIDLGKIPELIIISPDGNGRPGATSEWGNSRDGKQDMETFVVKDLVQYVDSHYRTIPDAAHRAIGGLSMGGFGAMNIAIHHPDVFSSVISLGGYYKAEGTIWGHDARYMQLNSPSYTIIHTPLAWKLHIFVGAATQDQPYYDDALQFMRQLNKLHIPYHFDLQQGSHSWSIWQTQMYNAIAWLKWGPSPSKGPSSKAGKARTVAPRQHPATPTPVSRK